MKWMKRIREFEDLVVWRESQNLAVEVYTITKLFPKDELYGITSQIRRSSSSVSANIAEGFGRSSRKELLYFYSVANGSLLETKNFLYLAEKLGYIDIQFLASRIKAEVLWGIGLMDTICPPSTQFAAYNKLISTKKMVIYPDFGHEPLPGWPDQAFQFLVGV